MNGELSICLHIFGDIVPCPAFVSLSISFLETFSITKVSPVCKTVLLPSGVQIICEGGLLDALQKKVTLSYSRTVLFLGAETISAASEREANKNNS